MNRSRTILITGATDGLGLELARQYRQPGHSLLLVGRRPWAETLLVDQFQPDDYCQVDLAQPDSAALVQQHLAQRGLNHLDLLIHNAGLGYYGPTAGQPAESIQNLVAVNLWAPVALTQALLPYLQQAGRGKVVFISSVVSTLPTPDYAVYGATKAALDGLARNLRVELGPAVAVQVIRPGATRTGMHAKSGIPKEQMNWERFPPAERVAAHIRRAIEGSQPAVTVGWANKLLHFGGRQMGSLVDSLLRRRYR